MPKISRTAIFAAVAAIAATPLLAAPADTIRARISGYRELGAAFKNVNDGLRAGEPQTIMIQMSAREIRNIAQQQYGWFPAGTASAPGVRSKAKGEIWAQPARFKAAQDAFAAQAAAFQRAAASGNAAAMRTEARKLGGACKGCHDSFRLPTD